MGQQFQSIEDKHRDLIERQKIFFVASAATSGRVNVSPKGMASLRVLGPNDVAYLDCTGSGSETRAHLMASGDKRLTIMFCAFEGDPVILRLYGQGQSLMRGTPEYAGLIGQFEEMAGARQIVRLAVDLVQTSCGMGVPLYDYKEDRHNLVNYWLRQTAGNLKKYWGSKNSRSSRWAPDGVRSRYHGRAGRTIAADRLATSSNIVFACFFEATRQLPRGSPMAFDKRMIALRSLLPRTPQKRSTARRHSIWPHVRPSRETIQ